MNLLDFDFTEENTLTEEQLQQKFEVLQDMLKNKWNVYLLREEEIPKNILPYLEDMAKKKWISYSGYGINIYDEYLKYHSVDEVVDRYIDIINQAFDKEGEINYEEDISPAINACQPPVRVKNREDKRKMNLAADELAIWSVTCLGLKHFMDKPSARGMKLDSLKTNWAKKNLTPVIFEHIQDINTFHEMRNYFRTHAMFIGRNDWIDYGGGGFNPPYPEYRIISPGYLQIAALCEATTVKEVNLILEHCGSISGPVTSDNRITIVFPKGWTHEDFWESLTEEDLEVIREDQERLYRLHNGNHRSPWQYV